MYFLKSLDQNRTGNIKDLRVRVRVRVDLPRYTKRLLIGYWKHIRTIHQFIYTSIHICRLHSWSLLLPALPVSP